MAWWRIVRQPETHTVQDQINGRQRADSVAAKWSETLSDVDRAAGVRFRVIVVENACR
jgi:hypothetical protein